ncbi:MAG: hypothetical protein QOI41_5993 [Myxococcales bacterium]|nr:hypothetical protein [Myxococcales bacterium]
MWACGSTAAAPAAPTSCDDVEVLVAASDRLSSEVCGAPNHCELSAATTGVDLGRDPQLAMSNGKTFFINRFDDRLFELDPKCGNPISTISVHVDGQGSVNPHDVAVAPDGALFVVLYNLPRIDIMKGKELEETIELSGYDDDGNPQAESIQIVNVGGVAKAFVALEVLDDNSKPIPLVSTRDSLMLRIDVATRKVEDQIVLAGRNPFNPMAVDVGSGALFLAEPGNFNAADEPRAGIERFDTATSTTRLLVTEHDLGGSVAEIAVTDGCGVAIVAGPQDVNPTSLMTFDPVSGKVLSSPQAPVLGPTPGYDLQALAWRGNSLYVGDRRAGASGYPIHVFERDPGTCNLHEVTNRSFVLPQKPVALRPAR